MWPPICADNSAQTPTGNPVTTDHEHAALLASYQKLVAEAAKKTDLVKAAAFKGPKAIATASETAAKAARRRDVMASKLAKLGIAVGHL